jgi:hypothetical protein
MFKLDFLVNEIKTFFTNKTSCIRFICTYYYSVSFIDNMKSSEVLNSVLSKYQTLIQKLEQIIPGELVLYYPMPCDELMLNREIRCILDEDRVPLIHLLMLCANLSFKQKVLMQNDEPLYTVEPIDIVQEIVQAMDTFIREVEIIIGGAIVYDGIYQSSHKVCDYEKILKRLLLMSYINIFKFFVRATKVWFFHKKCICEKEE